ncbi:hypothetical protein B0J14DRAFT_698523 [Halenospora varia]|nr:hypothetical protein B0J14DRAFT_698523 [Halenospora varia]
MLPTKCRRGLQSTRTARQQRVQSLDRMIAYFAQLSAENDWKIHAAYSIRRAKWERSLREKFTQMQRANDRSRGIRKRNEYFRRRISTTPGRVGKLPTELQLMILENLELGEADRLVLQSFLYLRKVWIPRLSFLGPRWYNQLFNISNFECIGECGLRGQWTRFSTIYRLRSPNLHPNLNLPLPCNLGWDDNERDRKHLILNPSDVAQRLRSELDILLLFTKKHRDHLWAPTCGSQHLVQGTAPSFQGPTPYSSSSRSPAILLRMTGFLASESVLFNYPGPDKTRTDAGLLVFEDELDVIVDNLESITTETDRTAMFGNFRDFTIRRDCLRLRIYRDRGEAVNAVCYVENSQ